MIGDDYEVDIEGARNAGMDQMLFLPDGTGDGYNCTFIIHHFEEVFRIL
jgi:putative hydrolase of the HAD superfamily